MRDVIRTALWGGRLRKRGAEAGHVHEGVLAEVEAGSVVRIGGYACAVVKRQLIDEERRLKREDRGAAVITGTGTSPSDRDLSDVPREVARTLDDAARFVGVALALAATIPADHPLGKLRLRDAGVAPARWWKYAEYLRDDIALGVHRTPWGSANAPTDANHARAWLALFFAYEHADEYLSPDEIPMASADKRRSDLFYQHKRRFKTDFGVACAAAAEVVRRAADIPSASSRRSLPLEWEGAIHPTLADEDRGDA